MTDRPILFSAPMVRALLAGRKTQTRRAAKFVQPDGDGWHIRNAGGGILGADDDAVRVYGPDYAPFAVGDRLWVKETWRAHRRWDEQKPSEILATSRVWHEADRDNCDQHGKIRVSIHMPRWTSRITLLVSDVRVERLQDCSEADAIAEGIEGFACIGGNAWRDYSGGEGFNVRDRGTPACRSYATLWDSINGPGAWEANPWVVAVTFEVVRGNIDTEVLRRG